MEAFTYKGISEGKYVEGEIEALNQDEASFKLKEQKVKINNLTKKRNTRSVYHVNNRKNHNRKKRDNSTKENGTVGRKSSL